MKNLVKDFCFSIWALVWLVIDETKKALIAMTGFDLLKVITKTLLFAFSAVCWIFIFFGMAVLGWAI